MIAGGLTDEQRSEKMQELRALVAAGATDEERKEFAAGTLAEKREAFGLDAPEKITPTEQAQCEQEYGGHEEDLLVYARGEGMDTRTVDQLRDAAIDLAVQAVESGAPLPEADLDYALKRFGPRLTDRQRAHLKRMYRQLESGA